MYLQYLISFYNGKRQYNYDDELDKRLPALPQSTKEHIFETFAQTSSSRDQLQQKRKMSETQAIQFIKTKAYVDKLICHIIALTAHLSTNLEFDCSYLAKSLKKDPSDLKDYFKEIGATYVHKKTKEGQMTYMVSYSMHKGQAKKLQQKIKNQEEEEEVAEAVAEEAEE